MYPRKRTTRQRPAINASSMADIAFLLLIFFLVSTDIQQDQGLLVRLPIWVEDDQPIVNPPSNNVLTVLVNGQDELLVEGEPSQLAELKQLTERFVLNPDKLPNLASKPNRAVISLRNDRSTSYATYLTVYNELQAAYHSLWDQAAQRVYGQEGYEALDDEAKAAVRAQFPMVISEAEPTDYLLVDN